LGLFRFAKSGYHRNSEIPTQKEEGPSTGKKGTRNNDDDARLVEMTLTLFGFLNISSA
jgi:hypothetical protein